MGVGKLHFKVFHLPIFCIGGIHRDKIWGRTLGRGGETTAET